MKYGDTLQQRSIPLWETYNIDYNDIKHLIKVRTTKGQAQATAIPGHDNEGKALDEFEEELHNELRQQHQRIDLFVKSKSGEIHRRLAHLNKQIAQLAQRYPSAGGTRISVRHLERFSKAEEATLKVGEDIQSLSRFVGAQRLAFQKLLKKYKKWTGSSHMGQRFQKEVLDRPTSFSKTNFDPLLTQWTEVLAAVRAPFDAGIHWQPDSSKQTRMLQNEEHVSSKSKVDRVGTADEPSTTSAHEIYSVCQYGSSTEFDTALAVLPLGCAAGKATYWVHPDNMVELHVLLLLHTRLRKLNPSVSSSPTTSSPKSSRSASVNSRGSVATGRVDDEVGVIICDDLQRFAKLRSSATIGDSEDSQGNSLEPAAASIRYSSSGEAIAVIPISAEETDVSIRKGRSLQTAKLKRKVISQLFEPNTALPPAKNLSGSDSVADEDSGAKERFETIRAWFVSHPKIRPLVQLQVRRTRFVGLKNSETAGLWATLDKDVAMRRGPSTMVGGDSWLTFTGGENTSESFPYAVLEIRYEGQGGKDLISSLDKSHLTERVRGFSLETHAVATLCKPQGMPSPFWLPALNQDIRKVPAPEKKARPRTSSSAMSPDSARTQPTSTSGTSIADRPSSGRYSAPQVESSATSVPDMLESPPLSAFKKKRRTRRECSVRNRISHPQQKPQQYQRYWNEFDDGDEGSDNEAYTIFIDPNASGNFPGFSILSNLTTSLVSSARATTNKVTSWLHPKTSKLAPVNETDPLLNSYFRPHHPPRTTTEDYDSDLSDSFSPSQPPPNHHYSTFPPNPTPHQSSHSLILFRSSLFSFVASFALLLTSSILVTTGRRKAATTVNMGVVIGVIWAFVFALLGVSAMWACGEKGMWAGRVGAGLGLAIVCVGGGSLVVVVGTGL